MDDLTRLLSDLVAIPSVNPMGRAPVRARVPRDPADRLSRAWFGELGVRLSSGSRSPRAATTCWPGTTARARAAHPLRRPSGHGAGRRHDDSSVRARDRARAGCTAGARATSRARWRRCSRPSPGWCASGRRGRPRCSWPARSTRSSRTPARRGWRNRTTGPTWRSSPSRLARPGSLPQGRLAVEDPHDGASPATARRRSWASTPSTGWAGSSESSTSTPASLCQVDRRPDPRAAELVGRPDRGGPERQRRSRLVRDRSRSPPDPGRRRRRTRSSRHAKFLLERLGSLEGIEFGEPWSTCPAAPEPRRMARAARGAIEAATGREPDVVGVPFGTDAGPLGARHALRRLRPRRHRPGPHQGRMDRPGAGAAGRRSLFQIACDLG